MNDNKKRLIREQCERIAEVFESLSEAPYAVPTVFIRRQARWAAQAFLALLDGNPDLANRLQMSMQKDAEAFAIQVAKEDESK